MATVAKPQAHPLLCRNVPPIGLIPLILQSIIEWRVTCMGKMACFFAGRLSVSSPTHVCVFCAMCTMKLLIITSLLHDNDDIAAVTMCPKRLLTRMMTNVISHIECNEMVLLHLPRFAGKRIIFLV